MQASGKEVAEAQIVDAIAEIREAMLVQNELEVEHVMTTDPCGQRSEVADAAIRKALLSSEDAMVAALQALPATGKPAMAN